MSVDLVRKDNQMSDHEIFELGDVVLQSGATLRKAKLAYKTYGNLNPVKDNVIVYPTWYSAQHYDNEWLIGEGRALDPRKYFIKDGLLLVRRFFSRFLGGFFSSEGCE
jgi:homoserine acetyltransferase